MGWLYLAWQVVYQAVADFFRDNGPQWAAAIAYYALLSVFPLLLAVVSIAAYFVEPAWAVEQLTRLLGQLVPRGTAQIQQVVQEAINARGSVSVLSVLALIWAGTRVFAVVIRALNVAFDVDETYGFLKRTTIELVTFLTIGLLLILAVSSQFILTGTWQALRLPALPGWLLSAVIPATLQVLALFLIYAFMPRRAVDWRAALVGALVAGLLMLAARPLFASYVERFANYNLVYGSLAIVITLIVWTWVLALLLLLGGELVGHLQSIVVDGIPPEEVERRHKQRHH